MQRLLDGKVVVVTGAGRGIGRAIAEEMAGQGADVVAVDYDLPTSAVETIEAMGRKCLAFQADVASLARASGITDEIIAQLGGLHVLVSNAGISQPKPLVELSEAEWDRTFDVNLKGCFNWCKAAVPHMLRQGWGRIVIVSSVSAKHGGVLGTVSKACYAATKAGLLGLTRGLAKELAPTITVNAICPGIIETAMTAPITGSPEANRILEGIPLGRFGRPDDVAHVAVFLVSPWADYLTGEIIDVNGGLYID